MGPIEVSKSNTFPKVIAVSDSSHAGYADRVVLGYVDSTERVLDVRRLILFPAQPLGTFRLHGLWHSPSDDELSSLDINSSIAQAHEFDGPASDPSPTFRRLSAAASIGGRVWTRSDHPVELDKHKVPVVDLVEHLRSERRSFPLMLVLHARQCEDPLPFTTTLLATHAIHPTDEVWVMPHPETTHETLSVGEVPYLTIGPDDDQGQDIYSSGFVDIVQLTGDEAAESLPADRFVGRASAIVIEAVGPRSHERLETYRDTDALVFLSYPWPPGSQAARTLWPAFRSISDTQPLADCLVHIAMQHGHEDEFENVARTLRVAFEDQPKVRELLLATFASLIAKESVPAASGEPVDELREILV